MLNGNGSPFYSAIDDQAEVGAQEIAEEGHHQVRPTMGRASGEARNIRYLIRPLRHVRTPQLLLQIASHGKMGMGVEDGRRAACG